MRRWLALAFCSGALACARAEPEPELIQSAAVLAGDETPARRQPLHLARLAEREPSGFPHVEHAGFECTRCHVGVPGHDRHRSIACAECHGPPPASAQAAPADCEGCHHARTQSRGCLHCHDQRPREPAPLRVSVALRIAGNAPPARALPFAHDRHAQFACTQCHAQDSGGGAAADCASCHATHHRAAADCASCHVAPAAAVHPSARVHQGCGGGGCHTDAAVLAMPLTPQVCLSCHPAQTEHEPGGDCAACHRLARRAAAAGRP